MNYAQVIARARATGNIVFLDELVPEIKKSRPYSFCDQSVGIVKRNF